MLSIWLFRTVCHYGTIVKDEATVTKQIPYFAKMMSKFKVSVYNLRTWTYAAYRIVMVNFSSS